MELYILGIVMSLGIHSFATCTHAQRNKRASGHTFPTPTTYPIPTLPVHRPSAPNSFLMAPENRNQPVLSGRLLLESVQVPCPHKRDTANQRVVLDDILMKQLYLTLTRNIKVNNKRRRRIQQNLRGTLKKINYNEHEKQSSEILRKDAERYRDWLQAITSEMHVKQDKKLSEADDVLSYILANTNLTKDQLSSLLGLTYPLDIVKSVYVPENRVRRQSSGTVTRTEYCTRRGSPTGDGFLHMCTMCALTTQLSEDSFPRYINEVSCDNNDCNCFTASGTAHGRCQPMIRQIKVLRRKLGACRLLVQDGIQLILDDWEFSDQPIHVGCECVMNKNSLFATFVPRR